MDKITIRNIEIELGYPVAIKDQKPILLTKLETKLLSYLVRNKNRWLTREQIENALYIGDVFCPQRVTQLIMGIRKKLGSDFIENCRGYGYGVFDEYKGG